MKSNALVLFLVAGALAAPAREAAAEGPIKNGLSSEAFRRNTLTTNKHALRLMLHHALEDQLLVLDGGYIAQQLADPRAQAMMHEIVQCALKQGSVTYQGVTWKGELGLCEADPGGPRAPRWGAGGPNEACQQLVTACVMARVNALKKAVPISLRGRPAALFPPRDPVSTDRRFRESLPGQDPSEGIPIASFNGPQCTPGPECGWTAAFVGRCQQGTIRLVLHNPSVCESVRVRICAGIHGCYRPDSSQSPPYNPDDPQAYGRYLQESTGTCSGFQIPLDCPVAFGGNYSVMTKVTSKPPGPGLRFMRPPELALVQRGGRGTYPARDRQVFTFREGAFYGNMFEPDELRWDCSVAGDGSRSCIDTERGTHEVCPLVEPKGAPPCVEARAVPYRHAYACYSLTQQLESQGTGDDDLGVAYLNDRICDEVDPTKPCFFHRPTRCHFADPQVNEHSAGHCAWLPAAGVYQSCRGLDGENRSYMPITTYLNSPCDLLDDADLCGKVRGSLDHPKPLRSGAH